MGTAPGSSSCRWSYSILVDKTNEGRATSARDGGEEEGAGTASASLCTFAAVITSGFLGRA